MVAPIQLKVISPDRQVFAGTVASLVFPGADGLFGVLPRHAPMISLAAPGVLRFVDDQGRERTLAVSGGFVQVKDDRVSVVADAAEMGDRIDLQRAQEAADRARKLLARQGDAKVNQVRAERALQRALARLQAGGR